MSTEQEQYIGKNGFGVPAEVFVNHQIDTQIPGGSGQMLRVYLSPVKVTVAEIKKSTLFEAKRIGSDLVLNIRTVGFGGDPTCHHPDLFAGRLLKAALDYMRFVHYQPIHTINGIWFMAPDPVTGQISVNTQQFLAQTGNLTLRDQPTLKRAAALTWTGRTAIRLGYSCVSDVVLWKPESDDVLWKPVGDKTGCPVEIWAKFTKP